jgi:hypothetical protein
LRDRWRTQHDGSRMAGAIVSKTPAECHQLLQDGYIYVDVR